MDLSLLLWGQVWGNTWSPLLSSGSRLRGEMVQRPGLRGYFAGLLTNLTVLVRRGKSHDSFEQGFKPKVLFNVR